MSKRPSWTRLIIGNALDGIARSFGIGAQTSDLWFEPFWIDVDERMGEVLPQAARAVVPVLPFAKHVDPVV